MTTPIYPSKLRDPLTLRAIDEMIQSWRGTPLKKVPRDVRIISILADSLAEAVAFNRALQCEVAGLAHLVDQTKDLPAEWIKVMRWEAMEKMHREAVEVQRRKERAEIEAAAKALAESSMTQQTEPAGAAD